MRNTPSKQSVRSFVYWCLWLGLLSCLPCAAHAQSAAADFVVRVLEKGSGVPVENATAVLGATDVHALTDKSGEARFTGAPMPPSIKVLAAGYETAIATPADDRRLHTVYLERLAIQGEGLEVVAERLPEKTSKITLSRQELLTTAGSQGDPLMTITSLPGVVQAGEGSGVVYMRGSDARDNIAWINRAPVGYLYHWGGAISTINPSLVEDFNVFLGGFPVEYGDRLGGVIDVRLRPPKKDRMHYKFDISTMASAFLVEGPVGGPDSGDGFFVAGRRSYIDLLFSPAKFNEQFGDDDDENPDQFTQVPQFYDYQASFNRRLERGSLDFYAYGARDALKLVLNDSAKSDPALRGELSAVTSYQTLGANWAQTWSDRLDHVMVLAYSSQKQRQRIGTDPSGNPFFINAEVNHYLWQPELHWKANEDRQLSAGLALDYLKVPLDLYISRPPREDDPKFDFTSLKKYRFNDTLDVTAVAPYLKERRQWTPRLATILGLRYSEVAATGGFHSADLSPRGAVEYALSPDTLLTASLGKYVQLPEGSSVIKTFGNPGLSITQATHRIVGVQHQIDELYSIKTEVYQKKMTDLVVVDDALDPPAAYSNQGAGEAWGIDVFLKRAARDRKTGWLALSYGKSRRTNLRTGVSRDFTGDQPFSLTLVWGQPFTGSWNRWAWSSRLQVHSGNPYTKVIGRHREDPADPNSRWIPEFGELNGARTPTYYKLDLRVDREILFDTWKMKFYVDLQNATLHKNIVEYDYGNEYEKIANPTPTTGMIFYPFIGVEMEF